MKKLLYLIILCSFSVGGLYAQPGTLDATFDSDGIVQTHISGYSQAGANGVVVQNDGKIIIGGYARSGGTTKYIVVRYNTDGSLDNTYGNNGIIVSTLSSNSNINGLALQSDGKLVAAGYLRVSGNNDFLALRYNTDGTLDTGFDTNGWSSQSIGTSADVANDVLIQTDGKIVVGGETQTQSGYDFGLMRFNTNGTLDTGFDSDGITTTSVEGSDSRCKTIALQSDGKIVAAGTGYGTDTDMAIARYNTDGSLDANFGTGGKLSFNYSISENIADIAIQDDGKILACGYTIPGGYYVMRLNDDGTLDNSFGTDGMVQGFDPNSVASVVDVTEDGYVLVAGVTYANGNGTVSDMALRRYTPEGVPDSTFGTNGVVYTDINNGDYDSSLDMAQQSDGKIILAGLGGFQSSIATDVIVTRYDGSIPVGVIDIEEPVAQAMVYPNPVQTTTTLEYELLQDQDISIELYCIDGRLITQLISDQYKPQGQHREELQMPSGLPAGQYLLSIQAGNSRKVIKIMKM